MSSYVATVTIPANTPENLPIRGEIRLAEKYIRRVQVEFRSAAGAVGVRLLDANSQLYPAVGSAIIPYTGAAIGSRVWITGDSQTVWLEDDEGVEMRSSPYLVTIEAYNTGGTPKAVEVRIDASNNYLGLHIAELTKAVNLLREHFKK